MSLRVDSWDCDSWENETGELFYPNLSEQSTIQLERSLIRAELNSAGILEVIKQNQPGDDLKSRDGEVLGMTDLALIVARLKKANLDYHSVLRLFIPDYQKKVEILCGNCGEFDLLPSTFFNPSSKTWGSYAKVLFKSSETVSTDQLVAKMRSVGVHGLKYIPPLVDELSQLFEKYGDKLPLPVFTVTKILADSGEVTHSWYAAGIENILPDVEGCWNKGLAPAGTCFAGMCEESFWKSSVVFDIDERL